MTTATETRVCAADGCDAPNPLRYCRGVEVLTCGSPRCSKKVSDAKFEAELLANPDDPRHGTLGGYTRGKCRCNRCSAVHAERKAAYYAKNAERIAERNAEQRARPEVKERIAERDAAYAAANPEKMRAKNATRRAAKANAPTDGSKPTWASIAERDGLECAYCGVLTDVTDHYYVIGRNDRLAFVAGGLYPTLDHVAPLSQGGSHSADACLLACLRCNTRKGATLDLDALTPRALAILERLTA